MITLETARKLALSFEEAEEHPHFEKPSFRVRKKIFATLDLINKQAVIKLSEMDQSIFSTFNSFIIFPVKGAWGKQGWTVVDLKKVPKGMFLNALRNSYCHVAPKKLADKYRDERDI